jgi:outer membrane protein OmpA-like peptidoglycan-associated protein
MQFISPRIPSLCSLALILSGTLVADAIGGDPKQSVFLDKNASRCQMIRALSAIVPDDCQVAFRDKTPVIHPAPSLASAPPVAAAAQAHPGLTLSARRTSHQRAMATPIAFAFDSARLTIGAKKHLDLIADVLQHPLFSGMILRIEGHTDATGDADYNLDLSRRRANAVQEYLASRHGIDQDLIPARGKGEGDLFDRSRPYAGINRRVEFVNTGLKYRQAPRTGP